VVNTHHHFDHSSGLRACAAEGATILTQSDNKPYYEKVWALPHTLNPDTLAKSPRRPVIEAVTDKRVLTDGARTLELYHLEGSNHATTMLIGFLPKEKMLIEADVFNPPPIGALSLGRVKEKNLYENLQRLKLDVRKITPLHGGPVGIEDLRMAIGEK
jgi:glyoxylase-like metal-dependent hydrolase (beta-lactamase superfamily II)